MFYPNKDIGRWLPWMQPGSTGRFSITILCILYSYHCAYYVFLVINTSYTAIGSGLYITKTLCLRIYRPQYVHTHLQCYKPWLVVRAAWTWGVVFLVPYRTAIRSGLTYIILGAIRTYLQYETIHHAWLVVFALWNRGWQSELSSIVLTTTNTSIVVDSFMKSFLYKKLKNVSCEYDRLNGWNSTLHRGTSDTFV